MANHGLREDDTETETVGETYFWAKENYCRVDKP
jgi:hypothetical protein